MFAKNKLILLVYWNQSILVTFLCFVYFRFKLQLFTKQLPIKFFQCISMFASLLSLDWKRDSILLRYANHLWILSIFYSVSEHGFFLFVRTDRKRVLRIDSIDDYRIIYIFYAVRIFCKIISHRLIRFSQKHKQLLMHNDKMLPNKWFLINTIKNKVGVNWISTKYDKKS